MVLLFEGGVYAVHTSVGYVCMMYEEMIETNSVDSISASPVNFSRRVCM